MIHTEKKENPMYILLKRSKVVSRKEYLKHVLKNAWDKNLNQTEKIERGTLYQQKMIES